MDPLNFQAVDPTDSPDPPDALDPLDPTEQLVHHLSLSIEQAAAEQPPPEAPTYEDQLRQLDGQWQGRGFSKDLIETGLQAYVESRQNGMFHGPAVKLIESEMRGVKRAWDIEALPLQLAKEQEIPLEEAEALLAPVLKALDDNPRLGIPAAVLPLRSQLSTMRARKRQIENMPEHLAKAYRLPLDFVQPLVRDAMDRLRADPALPFEMALGQVNEQLGLAQAEQAVAAREERAMEEEGLRLKAVPVIASVDAVLFEALHLDTREAREAAAPIVEAVRERLKERPALAFRPWRSWFIKADWDAISKVARAAYEVREARRNSGRKKGWENPEQRGAHRPEPQERRPVAAEAASAAPAPQAVTATMREAISAKFAARFARK